MDNVMKGGSMIYMDSALYYRTTQIPQTPQTPQTPQIPQILHWTVQPSLLYKMEIWTNNWVATAYPNSNGMQTNKNVWVHVPVTTDLPICPYLMVSVSVYLGIIGMKAINNVDLTVTQTWPKVCILRILRSVNAILLRCGVNKLKIVKLSVWMSNSQLVSMYRKQSVSAYHHQAGTLKLCNVKSTAPTSIWPLLFLTIQLPAHVLLQLISGTKQQ